MTPAELRESILLLRAEIVCRGVVEARMRELFESGRNAIGSLGPKHPYSWETVALVAFDCAKAATRPNVKVTGDAASSQRPGGLPGSASYQRRL